MKSGRNWTVSTRIWMLSGSLLAALLLVGGISYRGAKMMGEELEAQLTVHFPAVQNMTLADMMHDGIRANALAAVIASGSKDKEEVEEIRKEAEEFHRNIREYVSNIEKLPLKAESRAALDAAKPEIEVYVQTANEVVSLALAGKLEAAMKQLPLLKEKFELLEKKLEKVGEMIREDAKVAGADALEHERQAVRLTFLSIVLGFAVGLGLAIWINRGLSRNLREVISALASESESVGQSSRQMNEAAQTLNASTAQQATAIQETAASMDEISAMVQKTSEGARHLESLAGTNQASATKGQQAIQEMAGAIGAMEDTNGRIMTEIEAGNQKITEIVKVISEIGNKTKVINDIVFQTKLLSFNASVEAARAGEHGKGFAVVAEEVGKLAVMSGNSAKEISDLLGTSVARVEGIVNENRARVQGMLAEARSRTELSSKVAGQCRSALEEIVQGSEQVNSMINEMTVATREQMQGVSEVAKAISLLDKSTQANAGASQATKETAARLLGGASSLGQIVGTLEGLVVGAQRAESSEAPPAPPSENVTALNTGDSARAA